MSNPPEMIWATIGDVGTGSWNAEKSRMQEHMPDGWQNEYILKATSDKQKQELGLQVLAAQTQAAEHLERIAELERERETLIENINIKADWIEATINDMAAKDQELHELQAKLNIAQAVTDALCKER